MILYAEQYALAIIPDLIYKLNIIDYNNTHIFTDNLITFDGVYKFPKNPSYPKLLHKIHNYVNSKTILHKVTAHNPHDQIIGSQFAHNEANAARISSWRKKVQTPWFTWCYAKCARKNHWCYGQTDWRDIWDVLDPRE